MNETKENNNQRIREGIEGEFSQMEKTLASGAPGVVEVLRTYGEYEATLQQVEAYFAVLNAVPKFTTSSSSV